MIPEATGLMQERCRQPRIVPVSVTVYITVYSKQQPGTAGTWHANLIMVIARLSIDQYDVP